LPLEHSPAADSLLADSLLADSLLADSLPADLLGVGSREPAGPGRSARRKAQRQAATVQIFSASSSFISQRLVFFREGGKDGALLLAFPAREPKTR
jgi:hypothetical protein